MKHTTLYIITFTLAFTCAYSQQSPLPEKAAKLKESYSAAVERVTAPLRRTYLAELEKLKTEYTRAGDLPNALAIDSEIKALFAQEAPLNSKDDDAVNSKKGLQAYLSDTRWNMVRSADGTKWGECAFNKDGAALFNGERKWTVKDKHTVMVDQFILKFSDDLKTFDVRWGQTGDLKGSLITAK